MDKSNAINQAVSILQQAGIPAEVTKLWGGWQTSMVIVLPGVKKEDLDGSHRSGSDQ